MHPLREHGELGASPTRLALDLPSLDLV